MLLVFCPFNRQKYFEKNKCYIKRKGVKQIRLQATKRELVGRLKLVRTDNFQMEIVMEDFKLQVHGI